MALILIRLAHYLTVARASAQTMFRMTEADPPLSKRPSPSVNNVSLGIGLEYGSRSYLSKSVSLPESGLLSNRLVQLSCPLTPTLQCE